MSTAPPQVRYHPTHATVRISGAITREAAFRLADEIDLLVCYYHYSAIDLHIDSPGGEGSALTYLLQRLAEWRQTNGLVLGTLALTEAASAGALLLSFASVGRRRAHPGALLLYHRPWLVTAGTTELTEEVLKGYQTLLRHADERLLRELAQHIWDGAVVAAGRQTLSLRDTSHDPDAREQEIDSATALADVYRGLIARDRPITPEIAVGLRLIDRVESRA